MYQLARFTTAEGGEVAIQVPEDVAEPQEQVVTRGWGAGQLAKGTEQNLDEALARVQPAIRSLLSQVRAAADSPDEIAVEFGIQISVEVGAFISATSSANFRVTMKWTK